MARRIAYDAIIVLVYLFVGWQWAAALSVIGLLLFPNFWELITLGIILDGLFSITGASTLWMHSGFFTVISVLLLFASHIAKGYIRWYEA